MSAPDTWDQPGLTYDSGATWDGAGFGNPHKAMNTTKAITNFAGYKNDPLGSTGQFIHDQMVENAATFTTPTVTMAALATLLADYFAKLAAKASRARADVIAFNDSREALETALGRLGSYVNDVAQGDASIVEQSGFPSYNTARPPSSGAPAAPTNVRLSRGSASGSVLVRYKTEQTPSTNEVQINTGNPNTEADWHTKGIFKGLKAEITGLTPATNVWVRVRTVGRKGVMGDWSDPAEIIVT